MSSFSKRQFREWSLLLAVAVPLLLGVPALERLTAPDRPPAVPSGGMSLSVFDVGQGDAILAQEGDRQILIDGGPTPSILEKLGAAMPPGDRRIDLVVLTHPHADHIAGLVQVLERYEVGRVLMTDVPAPTADYRRWRELVADQSIPADDPQAVRSEKVSDMEYDILAAGQAADLRGSFHDGNSDGLNDSSIVGVLKFGRRRFLLMGDATSAVEKRLLDAGTDLSADFLKVGHHGSNYSTSPEFLAAVSPRYAATSVGAKNSYGNPAWRVMSLIGSSGAANFRTDRDGTVTAVTDGESLQVRAEKIK